MPARGCESNRRAALGVDSTHLHLVLSSQQLLQGGVEPACCGRTQRHGKRLLALERGERRRVARRRLQHLTLVHAVHRAHHGAASERVDGGEADSGFDLVQDAHAVVILARHGLLHVHQLKDCRQRARR